MKDILSLILRRLGYEIRRTATGLPLSEVTYANFSNLVRAYEKIFQNSHNLVIEKNSSRAGLLARLRGTPPSEAYFIIASLFQTSSLEGDVCEFGVAQGETSALIANEIRAGDRHFHLFDSFSGLSAPTREDDLKDDIFMLGKMEAYKGTMSFDKSWVLARLHAVGFPENRFTIHEGFIEAVIQRNQNLPENVSFAYVDFDLYAPVKTALEFLHTRTESGAIIMVDDYDFFSTGVKKAVDEFIQTNLEYQILVPESEFGCFAVLQKK